MKLVSHHLGLAAALGLSLSTAAAADPIADFYKGKQINWILSAGAGGGYSSYAHVFAPYFSAHIPGKPNIVVQNMPGAGGIRAMIYLANVAPKDGSTLGLVHSSVPYAPLYGIRGANFDPLKMNWIGSINAATGICVSWTASGVTTWQDLFDKELIVGGHAGVDPELTPRLYNAVLGTKFKIINGYNGTADIALAMERGEVFGIGDWSWSSLKKQKPDWIRDKKITLLLQSGLRNHPELPNVPNALAFAKTQSDRNILELFFTQKTVARPFIAPPGVPAQRLALLRSAFAALATDRDFLADAEKSNLEVEPLSGEEVDKIVALITSAPPGVAERYSKAFATP